MNCMNHTGLEERIKDTERRLNNADIKFDEFHREIKATSSSLATGTERMQNTENRVKAIEKTNVENSRFIKTTLVGVVIQLALLVAGMIWAVAKG